MRIAVRRAFIHRALRRTTTRESIGCPDLLIYETARDSHSTSYLWKPVASIIEAEGARRVFDLGCGNGATASRLAMQGIEVTGIDVSESGIRIAKQRCQTAQLFVGSAYDDLATLYGQFPVVLSLEVVEHCFHPRHFAKTVFDLVATGGVAIISTPYHGYLKNAALALSGKMDAHFTALWDGGHIKFWSMRTLGTLLREAGFSDVQFQRVGRFAPLAKSMIAVARKA